MAFSVAPTSGGGPYVVSAVFDDTTFIDEVNYRITVRYSQSESSCPTRGTGQPFTASQLATLLSEGSVETSVAVPASTCRTYTLEVLRVSDSFVTSSTNAFVDNL